MIAMLTPLVLIGLTKRLQCVDIFLILLFGLTFQTLFTLSIVGVKRHAARVEEIITSGGGRRKDGGSGKRAGDSNVDGPSPASMFGRMFKGDSGTGWLVPFK